MKEFVPRWFALEAIPRHPQTGEIVIFGVGVDAVLEARVGGVVDCAVFGSVASGQQPGEVLADGDAFFHPEPVFVDVVLGDRCGRRRGGAVDLVHVFLL